MHYTGHLVLLRNFKEVGYNGLLV